MTVWYVRTDYVSRVKSHLVGETLPNKSQMWIFHFSSDRVIELFHRRCLNDYFLLVFHFFVCWLGWLGWLGYWLGWLAGLLASKPDGQSTLRGGSAALLDHKVGEIPGTRPTP